MDSNHGPHPYQGWGFQDPSYPATDTGFCTSEIAGVPAGTFECQRVGLDLFSEELRHRPHWLPKGQERH